MPALVAGIHVFWIEKQDVDGRVKPGHDGMSDYRSSTSRDGSSSNSFTRTRNVTASRPSTMRWS